MGAGSAVAAPLGPHPLDRHRAGARDRRRGRRADRRRPAGVEGVRARASRPTGAQHRHRAPRRRARRDRRRRPPRHGAAGLRGDRRRLRGARPGRRPRARDAGAAAAPRRQPVPRAAHPQGRHHGPRPGRGGGHLRHRHAGPGVHGPRGRARGAGGGWRRRPHRLHPVAAQRPRPGRRVPRARARSRAPQPGRRRRRVRRARRRQPAHPRVPARGAHAEAREDRVLPRGVVPRPRAPPSGAHLDAPQRRARRHPRVVRVAHRARRRGLPLVELPRGRQRGVLRPGSLPRGERDRRCVRRPHEQPAVRGHARLRRRAGVLRPRGADGQARGRVRGRPDRAPPAQRHGTRRHAAHRAGRRRRASGRRGHPGVRRPAPAGRARLGRRPLPSRRRRPHDRHRRRAPGRRLRRGFQEPHVRRGLHGRIGRALPPRRRAGDDHVRRGRGRPGLRDARAADRPHGARHRRRPARARRHRHRLGRLHIGEPPDDDVGRCGAEGLRGGSGPARRPRRRGQAPRRRRVRGHRRAPPQAHPPPRRRRPGRRARGHGLRRAPRRRRRRPRARARARRARRHRPGRRQGAEPVAVPRSGRRRHRPGRGPRFDGGAARGRRVGAQPELHRLPHPDRPRRAVGRRHLHRGPRTRRPLRREGRRRASRHLIDARRRRRPPRRDRQAASPASPSPPATSASHERGGRRACASRSRGCGSGSMPSARSARSTAAAAPGSR